MNRSKQVVIMRGISGSGKSTYVRHYYPNAIVVSADHYFMRNGIYEFDRDKLADAHRQCRTDFQHAVAVEASQIVVDNTNTRLWEFNHYVDAAKAAGYQVLVVRLLADTKEAASRNAHGVPFEAVQEMQDRFEDYLGEMVATRHWLQWVNKL